MKPKTAIQKKLCTYAEKLPPLTDRQSSWAYKNVIKPLALYTRHGRRIKCLCCGTEIRWEKPFFDAFLDTEQYDCYTCGHTMPLRERSRDLNLKRSDLIERRFFVILTTFRGYQLSRTFEITRDNTYDKTRWSIEEFYQNWILPDGSEIITGRPHHRSPFFLNFSPGRPYEIKQHNRSTTGYYQMDDIFDICGADIYPIIKVTPLIRRNGWRKELLQYKNSISMIDAMIALLIYPTAEMLCKTGQLELFRHIVREGAPRYASIFKFDFLHTVRIANRRGYIVNDASLWLDMLRMAEQLGLDTHNPAIVCPEDLHAQHDSILARLARLKRMEKRQEEMKRIIEKEKAYAQEKQRFFDIELAEDDGLTVKPIKSVQEVFDEGTAMHHCVYSMGYYTAKDSLLLSARDGDGNRLETVELSLRTFKVLQSRGHCNKLTPFHNRIIALIENNAQLFRSKVDIKPA